MNRQSRRASKSNTKRAVRKIAKDIGATEPTADEKDPAFLALQVRALSATVQNLVKANENNTHEIVKAFSQVDIHQQILARITRDLTEAVTTARRLQVDGDVTGAKQDLGPLKVDDAGLLHMAAYHAEYRQVSTDAGPTYAQLACLLWSYGRDPEQAIQEAKSQIDGKVESGTPVPDELYQDEYFGGTSGQNHQQQEPQSAQASG